MDKKTYNYALGSLHEVRSILINFLPMLEQYKEYEKLQNTTLEVINDNKLSLIEKVEKLPKYEIDLLYGWILIEKLLQNKLNTAEYGGRLWGKFRKQYESEIEKLNPKDGMYVLIIWNFVDNPYNTIKHEIPYTKDFTKHEEIELLSIQDLNKIYNFIQKL